jgi:hypothetical protein
MKSTEQILKIMHVIAWIAFIGLTVQAVAILISYVVSWSNPVAAKDLYMSMDLYAVLHHNFVYYTQMVSFVVAILCIKAYVVYIIIDILSKVSLKSPFTIEVANQLETMSYVLLGVWLVSKLQDQHTRWLIKNAVAIERASVADEYIFIAGLVFIISKIFVRGIEIQSENELTV